MKKIFTAALVAALMLCSLDAFAQWSIGGGFVSSRLGGKDAPSDEAKSKNGFQIGVLMDNDFSPLDGLTFEAGLFYQYLTRKIGDSKIEAHMANLPLNIKYSYPVASDFTIAGYTGPRFNMGFAGNYYAKVQVGDKKVGNRRFDMQWGIGAAVTYMDAVQLRLGYDWGISAAYLHPLLANPSVYRNQLNVSVVFLF